MRALLERSRAARAAVALTAAALVFGLVHAAVAGDDLSHRRATDMAEAGSPAVIPPPGPLAPARRPVRATHREALPPRPAVAARERPLRIVLQRRRTFAKAKAEARAAHHRATVASSGGPATPLAQTGLPDVLPLPTPAERSALLSIYRDRTLRSGDAVMLADGLHVFRDTGAWPHRAQDFAPLKSVAWLDWRLRRTLQPLDRNPPTRWTAIMQPPA